jgi:hypothetical protein
MEEASKKGTGARLPGSVKLYYYTPLKKIKTDCFLGHGTAIVKSR